MLFLEILKIVGANFGAPLRNAVKEALAEAAGKSLAEISWLQLPGEEVDDRTKLEKMIEKRPVNRDNVEKYKEEMALRAEQAELREFLGVKNRDELKARWDSWDFDGSAELTAAYRLDSLDFVLGDEYGTSEPEADDFDEALDEWDELSPEWIKMEEEATESSKNRDGRRLPKDENGKPILDEDEEVNPPAEGFEEVGLVKAEPPVDFGEDDGIVFTINLDYKDPLDFMIYNGVLTDDDVIVVPGKPIQQPKIVEHGGKLWVRDYPWNHLLKAPCSCDVEYIDDCWCTDCECQELHDDGFDGCE